MGNMAQAIAQGFINSNKIQKENLFAFAPNQQKLNANAQKIGFTPCTTIFDLVKKSTIVIIACKPYQIESVLSQIHAELNAKAVISIAAGWTFSSFTKILGDSARIQCIMPNTPAMVKEGVLLFEKTNSLTQEELTFVKDLFSSLGIVEELPTELMGIGGAISGCGPAFMDLIMESYADAAVKYGISVVPRYLCRKSVSITTFFASFGHRCCFTMSCRFPRSMTQIRSNRPKSAGVNCRARLLKS